MEIINELIHASPPVALFIALFFLGVALKRSHFPNRFIPITQIAVGTVVYPFLSNALPVGYYHPFVTNMFFGFLIGGATTGLHQVFKSWLAKLGVQVNGDTEHVEKPKE